jgi:hypothetical protein
VLLAYAAANRPQTWTRRVLTHDSLVEFSPALATKGLFEEVKQFLADPIGYFNKEVAPWLQRQFGKLIADALDALIKKASEWLRDRIIDLIRPGQSSQLPKLYLSNLQRAGASTRVAEVFVSSVIESRKVTSRSVSDHVYVVLNNSFGLAGDAKAGAALANTIQAIR